MMKEKPTICPNCGFKKVEMMIVLEDKAEFRCKNCKNKFNIPLPKSHDLLS